MTEFLLLWAIFSCVGMTLEAVFTGVVTVAKSIISRQPIDWRLYCRTYLWSPLTYGLALAVAFPAIWPAIAELPWFLRGLIYAQSIIFAELLWGVAIKKLTGAITKSDGLIPWDYGTAHLSIGGYTRLDWAPLWFVCGLIFERIYVFYLRLAPGLNY